MPNPVGIDVFGNAPAYVFKPIKAVAITAASPVAVWTPATGKRFRLLGFCLVPTVAASILFEDATGGTNEFLRFPLTAAVPTAQVTVSFGQDGDLSFARANAFFLGCTA